MYNESEKEYLEGENSGDRLMSLYSPQEGYIKGNLFPELYDPYKNYKPLMLRGIDEKSRILLELGEISFASHELNLYLDVHPKDNSMIKLFNNYRRKANQLMNDYENKFGPITIDSEALNVVPFAWEEEAWPFEGGNK
ncbi:MAG: hypothetical protein HFJ38_02190 [Bacilli bacterium]|nr:hypothetical protein [Bacilli bacterium]